MQQHANRLPISEELVRFCQFQLHCFALQSVMVLVRLSHRFAHFRKQLQVLQTWSSTY